MLPQETNHMLNFVYIKTSSEIITKSTTKINQLRAKVEERRSRIKGIRSEYKITDAVYINLLEQARAAQRQHNAVMTYSVSNTVTKSGGLQENEDLVIPAGVVNNLLTETDFVKTEEDQATRLELICRNLKDLEDKNGKTVGHNLNEDELRYLGF
jgi:hypothetical protein